jgi:predicted GTPase
MQVFLSTKLSLDDLVEEIIPEIAKREKYSKSVRELMEEKINSIRDENLDFKISHFNILIMGNTGVGKSTLLNKVLKEQLAKTDFGNACTQGKPKAYESKNAQGIRIWDTKGIEQGN